MPRAALLLLAALLAVPAASLALAPPGPGLQALPVLPALPPFVPGVAEGYVLSVVAAIPAPTSINFGPGGPDLYATDLLGNVWRQPMLATPAGLVPAGAPAQVATGFGQPLGVAFADGAMFVSDSHPGSENARTDGRITRVDGDGHKTVVVDGLPNGRHNTNHLRVGPDGRLYVANGNPNDNGRDGGDKDVFPYSGALLSVDAAQVSASPAVLHWKDSAGNAIPEDRIASDPRNADFAGKVRVLAHGFRNVYGIAFDAAGRAYTAMNGPDDPSAQDTFYAVTPGADYGFPACYPDGAPGAVGRDVGLVPNPLGIFHDDCASHPRAAALLGWHVCATGLDIAPPAFGKFAGSAFVGECGAFFPQDLAARIVADPAHVTYDTGHKVARVGLDAEGRATVVTDFITGLALPTDVLFGPDGAMYVADGGVVYRVAALPVQP